MCRIDKKQSMSPESCVKLDYARKALWLGLQKDCNLFNEDIVCEVTFTFFFIKPAHNPSQALNKCCACLNPTKPFTLQLQKRMLQAIYAENKSACSRLNILVDKILCLGTFK